MDRSLLYPGVDENGMRWQERIVVSERAVALSRSLRKRMIALLGIIPVREKREGEPGDRSSTQSNAAATDRRASQGGDDIPRNIAIVTQIVPPRKKDTSNNENCRRVSADRSPWRYSIECANDHHSKIGESHDKGGSRVGWGLDCDCIECYKLHRKLEPNNERKSESSDLSYEMEA